jgi:type I restriction enzyme R subunit/putative DNA methylase
MTHYQRAYRPHWHPENAAIFLTGRLYGSLPAAPQEYLRFPAGRRFVAEDRALDSAPGPHHLENPAIARVVASAIKYGADPLRLYDLHAWVVMSNHAHMLIEPHVELRRITESIKRHSTREANKVLGRTGQPFWQLESYDHWVRTSQEFDNIIRYIEFNPVKAGLVANPEAYPWSSAGSEACVTSEVPCETKC